MPSIYASTYFQNLAETIDELHVHRMFAINSGYNPELIKQFYSTLYVSGDYKDPPTWKFDFMIQGKYFHMTVDELLSVVNLPQFEGLPTKIHTLAPMTPAEFDVLMDPEVIGDVCP